jgi:hypothetical protein
VKPVWWLAVALTCALGFGCASDDESCRCPPTDDDAADDDSAPNADDDNDNDDNDDDTSPTAAVAPTPGAQGRTASCGPPHDPPFPYNNYEVVWTAFVFDGEDLPFYGMYAYFWIDRYAWDDCTYVNTVSGLYLKGGGMYDNAFAGGLYSGYPVEYLSTERFDINVFPLLHARRDPDIVNLYHLDAVGPGFQGSFDILCRHVHTWWVDYYSCYDADLTDGAIDYQGRRYHLVGRGAYERWWNRGGFDPRGDEDNVVHGYWVYNLMHWDDGAGGRADTLTWVHYDLEEPVPLSVAGELSDGEQSFLVTGGEVNFDFPQNDGAGGFLRRYTLNATLAGGGSFALAAHAVKEYRDFRPFEGDTPETIDDREAHVYVEGVMDYDERSWTGRGEWEWRVTEGNPLPEGQGARLTRGETEQPQ